MLRSARLEGARHREIRAGPGVLRSPRRRRSADALHAVPGLDAVGSVLYNVTVVGLGYAVHDQLDMVMGWFRAAGAAAVPLVVGIVLALWGSRLVRRRQLLRRLHGRRLTPDQLHCRLACADPIPVFDLRAARDYDLSRRTVPGTTRMDPE